MTRRRPSRATPVSTPTPGLRLRQDVRTAVLHLTTVDVEDRQAIHAVNQSLHAALAYTAAMGELCQVADAVEAVHDAERHLDACQPDEARAALDKALSSFTDDPRSRPGRACTARM